MSAQLLKSFVLTHDEEVAFGARARHLLHTALAAAPKATPTLDKMGLRVYKDDIKKEYICTGLVHASLRDVAYALYTDCTRDAKTVAALLLGKAYQDAAVLRALLTRTDADPFQFFGAKLVSINKTGIFGKPKELVYLEYSGTYVPPGSGSSPVLYQILEWVDMTHYLSPANVWHRAIRPACSMVHLFRPVAGDARVVSLLSQTTYAREVPVYLRNLNTTASYCDHVQQLSTLPASRRLLDGNCLVQHWVPEAKACSVCALSFKALRPKYNCRSCGDVMCSNCTHHLQAPTTVNNAPARGPAPVGGASTGAAAT
ncbi:hypothetical protein SPRG_03661 [Saprolegnia parasitica CBS 223.65]|uniref:FYVE zinc finger domain-containing protein n=1 Tax=Saprolegnia parasitica (strain CBS 223.65) TaxID=695850 RepID=A0A067CZ12_SAPPC|nr:hypothetical protein SPRG_03661 [Saprolegnia parasitica CBS 223.65]KDO31741.1 hypothetical protein SPRG_03661 [Saprolegnia parasitica CBS 223.65]|eukprot:XP_012197622.1 hypothetical protein SPRG_03661 [Saprolegnia parasitica CBS 223.65]